MVHRRKRFHGTHAKKFTERPTLRSCVDDEEVMVSVGMSKLGVTQLMFVDPGVKIDSAYYCNVLLSQQLLPAIMPFVRFLANSLFFSSDTINLLERNTPAFISPDLWPPNSPADLNPVDYKVWGVTQHRVYQTKIKDLDDLKRRLIDVWAGIQQSLIDDAIIIIIIIIVLFRMKQHNIIIQMSIKNINKRHVKIHMK